MTESDDDNFYYYVTLPPGHEDITIRVQPLVGFVALYAVKCNSSALRDCSHSTSLPSPDHFTHSLPMEDVGSQSLLINRTDSETTHYLLNIKSESRFAAWRISVALSHTIVELQSGSVVTDRVAEGELDYFSYYFQHSGKGELQISLNPVSGCYFFFFTLYLLRHL